jgi:diguanylate cyclase (GGDEF)-like protein/PAS domain S-box-containing protein
MLRRANSGHRAGVTAVQARRIVSLVLLLAGLVLAHAPAAHALKAIAVDNDVDRLEITALGEAYEGRGDTLQIETAPGADGVGGRMSVRAVTPGTNPAWFVFALTNTTDKPVERWLVADRYGSAGSGVVWPDLDARRVDAVTPSVGYVPERMRNDRADAFRLTLEPGQTVTFVAELASDRFARLYLWKAIEYEQKARDRQLFSGIMLGITGLLAIFLTAVFAANHKAIFPTAAIFTWCVLAYLCVDFGFWHKLFNVRPEENAQYRAATEAGMAATLLIFLYTFLRLGAWHGFVRMLLLMWIAAQLTLVAVAFLDPRLAATFARLSMISIAGVGAALTLFLALRGQDRALSLVPTWILLLVWLFGAGVTFTGRLSGDIVVFGLTAGLVLIVVLIGFTVTQYAFRAPEPHYGAQPGEQQLRSLAVEAAGAAVWEWLERRDEVKVSPLVEAILGLKPGELSTKTDDFTRHMHPADRERFKLLLAAVKERASSELRAEFRMRHVDNSYRWFELDAASVSSADRRNLRCVGLIREVTDAKRAQERLMHDAVHDSLSGLPNRELFLDRLAIAAKRATLEPLVRPALLFIDIDKFKSVNSAYGLVVGDSLLLTIARRLGRNLGPQDTLARVGGDQFALLVLNQSNASELAMLAEQVRRSLHAPINISGQEIVLTASIGIALYDGPDEDPAELLREAEIAMYRAKRSGPDKIEIFNASMRTEKGGRPELESDLRRAIEKKQLRLVYQPIYYLPTESLAGFEALLRWEHPTLGTLNPAEFVPIAEETDLIIRLGSYVLARAVREGVRWQKELPRPDAPVFVSINVSSRQLFRPELIREVRHILGRAVIPRGSLRLEITESVVMENPEKATAVLRQLAEAGAGLALDDFGTGYSSLSYLNQFTFDTIKIDRSFLHAGSENGTGPVILRSVVALAHELGKNVVVEGIETEEDVGLLRTIGCEYGQGFFYGEPMTERDALQRVRAERRSERRLKRGLLRARRATVQEPPQQAIEAEGAIEAGEPVPALQAAVRDIRAAAAPAAATRPTAAEAAAPRPSKPTAPSSASRPTPSAAPPGGHATTAPPKPAAPPPPSPPSTPATPATAQTPPAQRLPKPPPTMQPPLAQPLPAQPVQRQNQSGQAPSVAPEANRPLAASAPPASGPPPLPPAPGQKLAVGPPVPLPPMPPRPVAPSSSAPPPPPRPSANGIKAPPGRQPPIDPVSQPQRTGSLPPPRPGSLPPPRAGLASPSRAGSPPPPPGAVPPAPPRIGTLPSQRTAPPPPPPGMMRAAQQHGSHSEQVSSGGPQPSSSGPLSSVSQPPQQPRPAPQSRPVQGNGARPPVDFSRLPPAVAASLARLSGRPVVPAPREEPKPVRTDPDGKPSKS